MQDALGGELRLDVSPPRNLLSVAVFAVLAFLLGSLALAVAGERLLSAAFFGSLALLSFYSAVRMWSARSISLILTDHELRSSTGQVLCRTEDITGVERGMLAFKPSGGFIIRLKSRQSRAWVPGIWWRLGRSVGVGGVTMAGQARAMADVLTARTKGKI